MAVDPAKFVREVRAEVAKVTWPSRRETMVTTGLVFLMVAIAAPLAPDDRLLYQVRSRFVCVDRIG